MNRIDRVKALHDLTNLSVYSGWLESALKMVDDRFNLTNEEETQLAGHVEVLQGYLASKNQKVSNRLFLETACFIPGQYRGKLPPLIVLNPNRGGFSESRVREAANWVNMCETRIGSFYTLTKERLNRLLDYTGLAQPEAMDDVREVITLLIQLAGMWKRHDLRAELRQLHPMLEVDEAQDLVAYSLVLLDGVEKERPEDEDDLSSEDNLDQRVAESILEHLAVYQPSALQPFHRQLLERDILYPPYLFRSALPSTTDLLWEKIENSAKFRLNHLLILGLVWSGNATAQQHFYRSVSQPPAWWKDTYKRYSLNAGWALTATGARRDLYFESCFQLIPYDTPQTTRVFAQREDRCPWCEQPLEDLLILDLQDARLQFLGLSGSELRVVTCPSCLPWMPIFGEVDYDGKAVWSAFNSPTPPIRSAEHFPMPNTLGLAPVPRNPLESYVLEDGQSQVGGLPWWVNHANYLDCPQCGSRMCFIGQVQMSDIMPAEGWTYALLCKDCQITGTYYDQT
jgi:hypothetical protein